MKISELTNAPQWLLDAKTEDADVEIINGVVHWNSGTWRYGDWHGGTWCGGAWLGGTWRGGFWRDGFWRCGTWLGGTWLDGDWRDGVWRDGIWHDGTWYDGNWYGGKWHGGEWVAGRSIMKSKYDPIILDHGRIKVGCKIKTAQEWLIWLNGDEEFDTPREDPAFKEIRAHILAAIAYAQAMEE